MIPPGTITIEVISPPSNGSVSLSGTTLTYIHEDGFSGNDSYTYNLLVDGSVIGTRNVCITIVNA